MQYNAYLNDVTYKSDNQILTLSGGLNDKYPPQFIDDNQAQSILNFCMDKFPAARTRVGRTFKAGIRYNNALIPTSPKPDYFGIAKSNEMFYIYNGGLYTIDGSQIATGIGQSGDKYKTLCYEDGNHEYLIIYGKGINPTRHLLPLSSLNTPEQLTMPSGVTYFEHMCYHKDRMFGSFGDMLYISNVQNPNDWSTQYYTGEMRIPQFKKVVTMASYNNKLICFGESNVFFLYGSQPNISESNYFYGFILDNNIGAYSDSICVQNGMLYFISGKGIYEYRGNSSYYGEQFYKISEPSNYSKGSVEKEIEGLIPSELEGVTIAGTNNKIYFNIPSIEKVLVFDQIYRTWSIEEESYINIVSSTIDTNYTNVPEPIYGFSKDYIVYEVTGVKHTLAEEYYKVYGKDDVVTERNQDGTIKTLTQVLVPFNIKTKEFKNGTMSHPKSLSKIWINYDLAEGATCNLEMTTDDGRTAIFEDFLEAGENLTKPFLIPNNMQDCYSYTLRLYGEGDITIYSMERVDRTNER